MKKRLLIIPARAGSKRIKNKNFKIFSGNPIIYQTINTALKSKLFHTIHVSTDSLKLLNTIKNFKINTDFLRPNFLSTDNTPLTKVIKFVIDKLESDNQFFDQVWIFMPCSPLVLKKNLIEGSRILDFKKNSAFTTVAENSNHPQWSFFIKDKFLHPMNKNSLSKKSQELKKTYFDLGLLAGWKKDYFLQNLKKNKKYKFSPLILNKFQSVDIDNLSDWKFAEIIYKHKYHL